MYYSDEELVGMGITLGRNVRVHRTLQIFGGEHISIGDNSRIDAFGILSAGASGMTIGRHCHLAAGVYIFGASARVTLDDFVNLSSRVAVYAATDDFTDGWMVGPTVPDMYRKVNSGPVSIGRHVVVGTGSVVLPSVTLGIGSSVGALSLVRKDVDAFTVVAGNPLRCIKKRNERLLDIEADFAAGRPPCVACALDNP
jgi:dTDP-4-amino-4,6-dideoxy-D-glucose acyltransferase